MSIHKGDVVCAQLDDGFRILRVAAVDSGGVQVERLDGQGLWDVSSRQVRPLHNYVADGCRHRKWSILFGSLLKWCFGEGGYERVRSTRRALVFDALDQAGVLYTSRSVKARDRITLWPDPDRRPARRAAAPAAASAAVLALLPKWTAPDRLPPGSRDPLGFQAGAAELADRLLPGMTVFTARPGYCAFLAWALEQVRHDADVAGANEVDLLLRLERALVTCDFFHHGPGENGPRCVMLGGRGKGRILRSADSGQVAIPERILRRQRSTGCLNLYRGFMVDCGFWAQDDWLATEGRLPYRTTPLGQRLARQWRAWASGAAKGIYTWARDESPRDVDRVRGWGADLCFLEMHRSRGRGTLSPKGAFLDGVFPHPDHADNGDARRHGALRQATTATLFAQGLFARPQGRPRQTLTRLYEQEHPDGYQDSPIEDEAARLSNADVLCHFASRPPREEFLPFQVASAYEFASVALNELCAGLLGLLAQRGRVSAQQIAEEIFPGPGLGSSPAGLAASGRTPAHVLFDKLLAEGRSHERALLAVRLLAEVVLRSPFYETLVEGLGRRRLVRFCEDTLRPAMALPLRDWTPTVFAGMVEHHLEVSRNKGKQPWMQWAGAEIVRDDLRELQPGVHSYRFPQLASMVRDLALQPHEVDRG